MAFKSRILVVDDNREVCEVAAEMLRGSVHLAVATETDPKKAIGLVKSSQFDLILTDLMMGNHSGMEVLEAALEADPDTVVVFMTGYPTVENATQALKNGAYDFLVKPFQLEQLLAIVERGLRKLQLSRENIRLKEQLTLFKIAEAMGLTIHLSTALNQVLKLIMKEFGVDAASILFYDNSKSSPFVLQAIQAPAGIDRSFLEGRTNHTRMAVKSKIVEIEYIYASSAIADDVLEQDMITTYLSCPLLIRGRVIGVLNMHRANIHHEFTTGELQSLKVIASKAAYAISNSKLYDDLGKAYLSTIMALANAVEARDRNTSGHTVRVTYLAELIAKEFGWAEERLFILSMGCSLHDIGKIGVPDSILNKPGFLTPPEMQIMRRHTELGARIIEGVDFLRPCLPFITAHHEWWDGTGYPGGLKNEEIPIEGRILAVADSFDAMVTDRPYRRGRSIEEAVQELVDFSGRQFDPAIVDIFRDALNRHREKIEVIYGATASDRSPKTAPVKT